MHVTSWSRPSQHLICCCCAALCGLHKCGCGLLAVVPGRFGFEGVGVWVWMGVCPDCEVVLLPAPISNDRIGSWSWRKLPLVPSATYGTLDCTALVISTTPPLLPKACVSYDLLPLDGTVRAFIDAGPERVGLCVAQHAPTTIVTVLLPCAAMWRVCIVLSPPGASRLELCLGLSSPVSSVAWSCELV